jgi:pimeloyl-ACP methyl ester carboxylesterase
VDIDYVVMPAIILAAGILIIWLSIRRFRSLSAKVSSRWRRVAERIVLLTVILLAVTVAGSTSYNAIAHNWFRAHNPPPGSFYIVDGHRMRMSCTGSGSPTVILESGLGNDGLIWDGVQQVVARTTRVCSYDRAGFGWSDPVSGPRDADHVASQLHALLLEARITGPIVLMGHSLGGIFLRDYATRYPADLAGIVFVDAATPLQRQNPAMKAAEAEMSPPIWVQLLIYRTEMLLGVSRLFGSCPQRVKGFAGQAEKLQAEALCAPSVWTATREEIAADQSGLETLHTGPFGALPILIFSRDPAKSISGGNPPQFVVDAENAWNQMQENLKTLSTRSRRIIVKGSGHVIQLQRPEVLEKELPLFIEQIRGTAPQPDNWGSTSTE